MKKSLLTCMLLGVLVLTSCVMASHNPLQILTGKQTKVGFGDYGAFNHKEGLVISDIPRENTTLEIEFDSEAGVSYDPKTGTVKGIVKITRSVGPQVTGYLVELAQADPEAAKKYLEYVNLITQEQPK